MNNLIQHLNKAQLYCFTPDKYLNKRNIIDIVRQEIKGGCDIIQLREKTMNKRNKLQLAFTLRQICLQHNVLFIVNDDLDIALLSDADGLHLGQEDIAVAQARKILKNKIIGLSTHNQKQYQEAQQMEVDYVAIGPVFKTFTKEKAEPVIGIENLPQILKYKQKPTVAIGGITLQNLDYFRNIDVDIFAIITDIIKSENIEYKTRIIKEKIKNIR